MSVVEREIANGRVKNDRWRHTAEARVSYRDGVQAPRDNLALHKIVSRSPLMERVFQVVRQAAAVDSTVLITGESGTGKELIAEAIHASSPRRKGPFVTVNMAALPESLVESELFGHVRGSFTGAGADRVGRFEAAQGGTIFIDEIGDLQPASQAKLLRVIENRVVTPVGGNDQRAFDARVVAATNRSLEKMVAEHSFRDDLYYRLNIVRIALPPLRERREDIPLLVRHFVEQFVTAYGRPMPELDDELMEFLASHSWPGNIRQLRNCVESMVVLAESDQLRRCDVPATVFQRSAGAARRIEVPDDLTLEQIERAAISQVLERCGGNRKRAAQKLDISVRTLQRKLVRWKTEAA